MPAKGSTTKQLVPCAHCGALVSRTPSALAYHKEQFCNKTCKGNAQASRSIASFWEKSVVMPSGCREWARHRDVDGYGRTKVNGKDIGAHQLAWKLTNGEIPSGHGVLHKCDNPPCCEPAHLFTGTVLDNNRDMLAKGRYWNGRGVR